MAQRSETRSVPSTAIDVTVNGESRAVEVDNRTTLLDLLRERLDLTGSKKGCDHGQCGACTVLLDGRRTNSCLVLAVSVDGREVTATLVTSTRVPSGHARVHAGTPGFAPGHTGWSTARILGEVTEDATLEPVLGEGAAT